jgi:hypothetical protein
MADHKHGEMDTSVHEATFNGFMTTVTRGAIFCIALLVFIALVNG